MTVLKLANWSGKGKNLGKPKYFSCRFAIPSTRIGRRKEKKKENEFRIDNHDEVRIIIIITLKSRERKREEERELFHRG